MHEEIEDCGIIVQDYTAVSDWEIFILKIEEAINDWKIKRNVKEKPLEVGDFAKYPWKIMKEDVQFGNDEFVFVRYRLGLPEVESGAFDEGERLPQALTDLFVSRNDFERINPDFEEEIPPIAVQYGFRDFAVLIPSEEVTDESKIKMLMSSITIAANNTNCELPVFVQCHEKWQNLYLGILEGGSLCTKFDTVHLRRIPAQCYYLIGLLDVFKGKISSTVSLDAVQISTRFSYLLTDFPSCSWTQAPPDFDFLQGQTLGVDNFSSLPFGAVHEPIKSFILRVLWLQLTDDTIVDSQSYTDFDPLSAPVWNLSIDVDKPVCLLSEYYSEFINFYKNLNQLSDILNDAREFDFLIKDTNFSIGKPIANATSKILDGSPTSVRDQTGVLSNDALVSLLKYIFIITKTETEAPIVDEKSQFAINSESLKADSPGGLLWRLAIVSAQVSQTCGGVAALGHLWYEFCQEIRYRWENSIVVDGVMDGFPNSRTGLLHQKLQMLNICIDRKKSRNEAAMIASLSVDDSSNESDDEFFDCDADENESKPTKPIGRLGPFGNLKLIATGEPMFVPITQQPVPKTEDQLEQDAEVMLNLGTDAHASEMRANLMSASLLSDMESFKAANPEGLFEDFIRWYSPKDWIKDEEMDEYGQKKGHLSQRMTIENNVWIQVWRSAKPVPAKRQKRLFDDTTEAEKTLHFLETRNISQIVDLLLPSLTNAVLHKLAEECNDKKELIKLGQAFDRLLSSAVKLTRDRAEAKKYKSLAEQLYNIELAIAHCKSLRLKFNIEDHAKTDEQTLTFLSELLTEGSAVIPGAGRGKIGSRVSKMYQDALSVKSGKEFSDDQQQGIRTTTFPSATEKEFVLRVMARRPASTSTPSPQMMRVIIKRDEFKMLGAFSEDNIFV